MKEMGIALKEMLAATLFQAHANHTGRTGDHWDYWQAYSNAEELRPYRELRDVWLAEYDRLDRARWSEVNALPRLVTMKDAPVARFTTPALREMCAAFLTFKIFL